jgi:dCMP deaminase
VIYLSDKYDGTDASKASKLMLDKSGVGYRKVLTAIDELRLSYNEADV